MVTHLKSVIPVYNITLYRGDGETFEATIVEYGTEDPINLTDLELNYTVKTRYTDLDAAAILQKTVGSGIEIVDAAGGVCRILFTREDLDDLIGAGNRETKFYHDFQIQAVDQEPHTVFRGTLIVQPDVTNQVSSG